MFITDIDKFIDTQLNFTKDYITRYKFNKNLKKETNLFIQYHQKIISQINWFIISNTSIRQHDYNKCNNIYC